MYLGSAYDILYTPRNLYLDTVMGSSSYLGKPKSGLKSSYANSVVDKENYKNKRAKLRRSLPKMSDYGIKRRFPDYTELAYKEAVSRLRYFLSESYAPSSRNSRAEAASIKNLDESGDEHYDIISKPKYPISLYTGLRSTYVPVLPPSKISTLVKKYPSINRDYLKSYSGTDPTIPLNISTESNANTELNSTQKFPTTDPELMGFIQKQEEYIEQLERESSYCREELNNLLGKVKEVISENETLHEKQKSNLISGADHRSGEATDSDDASTTGMDSDAKYSSSKGKKSSSKLYKQVDGPNILYESKISELEAQLTQANIDLKKIQEENNDFRRRVADGIVDSPCLDSFKRQIDSLQRDKSALEMKVSRLQATIDDYKDSDANFASKFKRTEDLAYQANHEKTQLELEIRRLKDELDRQQNRVRELLGEQARRVMEERSAIERRYNSQVEQLTSDLTNHWDSATKLQLELERQKREESDLKRELSQKNSLIEDLKMELKNKVASLQADIAQVQADKSAVEEELANARLILERHQRQAKHDTNRLNSEIQSLRQRLDRADADCVHSRRENLRLIEQLSNLEKEMRLKTLRPTSPTEDKEVTKDKKLTNMITDMEKKHAQTVSELESMVGSQNILMEKLTAECHLLTSKLDDASQRHKQEMAALQNKLDQLSARVSQTSINNDYKTASNNMYKTAPTNNVSRQNSSNNFRNGNQHPSQESIPNTYGSPTGESNRISRQSSRNSVRETPYISSDVTNDISSDPNQQQPNVEDKNFEKQLRESEPNPSNRTLISPHDNSSHSVSGNNISSSDANQLKGQEYFGEAQSENEYTEQPQTGYDPNDPNVEYQQQPLGYDQNYIADPNQTYENYDPANNTGYDPNYVTDQTYDTTYSDPNQQYTDPNQQYATDETNPQYVADQQYSDQYDPNQQQFTQQ